MELNTLKALYVEKLKDLFDAENQIVQALPKMAQKATSSDLRRGFEQHLEQTRGQIATLERIFQDLGEQPGGKTCKGMKGLLAEGEELMKEKADPDVLDAGMIAAAQAVEHYEMAGYGTARTYARELGRRQDADLLQRILDQEGETDKKLTTIAIHCVNCEAMHKAA